MPKKDALGRPPGRTTPIEPGGPPAPPADVTPQPNAAVAQGGQVSGTDGRGAPPAPRVRRSVSQPGGVRRGVSFDDTMTRDPSPGFLSPVWSGKQGAEETDRIASLRRRMHRSPASGGVPGPSPTQSPVNRSRSGSYAAGVSSDSFEAPPLLMSPRSEGHVELPPIAGLGDLVSQSNTWLEPLKKLDVKAIPAVVERAMHGPGAELVVRNAHDIRTQIFQWTGFLDAVAAEIRPEDPAWPELQHHRDQARTSYAMFDNWVIDTAKDARQSPPRSEDASPPSQTESAFAMNASAVCGMFLQTECIQLARRPALAARLIQHAVLANPACEQRFVAMYNDLATFYFPKCTTLLAPLMQEDVVRAAEGAWVDRSGVPLARVSAFSATFAEQLASEKRSPVTFTDTGLVDLRGAAAAPLVDAVAMQTGITIAAANVIDHSNATQCEIRSFCDARGRVVVVIKNNGSDVIQPAVIDAFYASSGETQAVMGDRSRQANKGVGMGGLVQRMHGVGGGEVFVRSGGVNSWPRHGSEAALVPEIAAWMDAPLADGSAPATCIGFMLPASTAAAAAMDVADPPPLAAATASGGLPPLPPLPALTSQQQLFVDSLGTTPFAAMLYVEDASLNRMVVGGMANKRELRTQDQVLRGDPAIALPQAAPFLSVATSAEAYAVMLAASQCVPPKCIDVVLLDSNLEEKHHVTHEPVSVKGFDVRQQLERIAREHGIAPTSMRFVTMTANSPEAYTEGVDAVDPRLPGNEGNWINKSDAGAIKGALERLSRRAAT